MNVEQLVKRGFVGNQTLSSTNTAEPDLGLNSDRRGKKLAGPHFQSVQNNMKN
jgi:hypothetical protein